MGSSLHPDVETYKKKVGTLLVPAIEEVQGCELFLQIAERPKVWFTVPLPLDRKTTVSPLLKDHFGDHNLQRDDDMGTGAI
jgi:hypothetical protein